MRGVKNGPKNGRKKKVFLTEFYTIKIAENSPAGTKYHFPDAPQLFFRKNIVFENFGLGRIFVILAIFWGFGVKGPVPSVPGPVF